MQDRIWTESDFDTMTWHDAIVHGMRLIEGEDGDGALELDIDYIHVWVEVGGHLTLHRQPATLTFHHVFDLRMSIDFAACSAAFAPLSMDGIERKPGQPGGSLLHAWKIPLNWPIGEITFLATGFEQRSKGEPGISERANPRSKDQG